MERVDIAELRAHIDDYLDRMQRGEAFELCDGDRAIGALELRRSRKLNISKPATRPAADLFKIQGIKPSIDVDVVELLRESRDQR